MPNVVGQRAGWARFRSITTNEKKAIPVEMVDLIKDYARQTARDIIREMRVYPPELPDQKYVRTYNLRDSWSYTETDTSSGFKVAITSEAAGYSEKTQKPSRKLKTAKPIVKIKLNRKLGSNTREEVMSGGGAGSYIYYAARVVGDIHGEGQAPIHQGRWQLFADVVESHRSDYRAALNDIRRRYR